MMSRKPKEADHKWKKETKDLKARIAMLEAKNMEIRHERDDALALLNSCRKQIIESRKTMVLIREMLQSRKRARSTDSDKDIVADQCADE